MKIKQIKVGSLKTNCYLLVSKNELLIIDPGAEAEKIIKQIKKSKGRPIGIVNTHTHYDHTGANRAIKDKFNLKILTGPKIKVGKLNLKVVETPGHKEDAVTLIGKDFAFTGDTLFKNETGRTDLPGGSYKKLKKSIEKLSKELKEGMKIYPGHGESFTLKNTNLKEKYIKNA